MAENEYADVEAALREAGERRLRLQTSGRDAGEAFRKDRSHIARMVLGLYCGVVGIIALYLVYRGIFWSTAVFEDLAELLKIAVVPVVALVIGFYFGSRSD